MPHAAGAPATSRALPRVIQGGMGVAVSKWRLANAVARTGNLGLVSGSMLDAVLVRRLQDGDVDGHLRRAFAHSPMPHVVEDVLRRHFLPSGRPAGAPYEALPMYRQVVSDARRRVTVLANFAEVWLAREDQSSHQGADAEPRVAPWRDAHPRYTAADVVERLST